MKALGAIESKWDHIRKKLARRLLEEQDKVLRSYFAQKGGQKGKRSCAANPRDPVRYSSCIDLFTSIGVGAFRYSAALVPWTEKELERLEAVCTGAGTVPSPPAVSQT